MRQIDLKADVSTALITELSPKTDYTLTIHAVYPNRFGDSAAITVQTSGCHTSLHAPFRSASSPWTSSCLLALLPQVSNFRVIEEGLFSLRLGWTPPLGKLNGFKIFIPRCTLASCSCCHTVKRHASSMPWLIFFFLFRTYLLDINVSWGGGGGFVPAANRPGFTYEHLLPGDTSSHVIDSLEEDKEYVISIYAIYPQGPSEPVSVMGKTCKFFFLEDKIKFFEHSLQ